MRFVHVVVGVCVALRSSRLSLTYRDPVVWFYMVWHSHAVPSLVVFHRKFHSNRLQAHSERNPLGGVVGRNKCVMCGYLDTDKCLMTMCYYFLLFCVGSIEPKSTLTKRNLLSNIDWSESRKLLILSPRIRKFISINFSVLKIYINRLRLLSCVWFDRNKATVCMKCAKFNFCARLTVKCVWCRTEPTNVTDRHSCSSRRREV